MANNKLAPTRGYPLIALFLILTACGIVAALVGPAMRNVMEGKIGARDAALAIMGCSISIMALGGLIGLFHFHRGRGFLWGIITGGVIGVFVGPMMMAPRTAMGTLVGLSLGGSAIIVLVAVAYRISVRPSARTSSM
jgi:hypothetical protein